MPDPKTSPIDISYEIRPKGDNTIVRRGPKLTIKDDKLKNIFGNWTSRNRTTKKP